ncbi:MAG TPA: restriction endonuclease [Thermoanaerobaculia bacterium]
MASDPGPKDRYSGRLKVPAIRVLEANRPADSGEPALLEPLRVELVSISSVLWQQLQADASTMHHLSPAEFEELICDRLFAMGFEPKRVGATNARDGGVDIIFWPRTSVPFPFLGAAQVKHRQNPRRKESSATVRDFAAAISGHPFNAGLLVSNTSFSADAEWFARERAKLVRLRGFDDIRRWLLGKFDDDAEWREIPRCIQLCPGVIVDIR